MTPIAAPGIVHSESLRVVGAYLDQQAYHLYSMAVVPEGLVAVVRAAADTAALLLTPAVVQDWRDNHCARRGRLRWTPTADPLVPTGYDDLLRAIGTLAVRYGWTWLRLVRAADAVLLHHGPPQRRQRTALSAEDIAQILELTYLERAAIRWALAHPRPRSGRNSPSEV